MFKFQNNRNEEILNKLLLNKSNNETMFETTQDIVNKTEAYILKKPYEFELSGLMKRYFTFPLYLLLCGFNELIKPILIFCFTYIFSLIVINVIDIQEFNSMIMNICLIFTLFVICFAMPSTYAYSGISKTIVNSITKIVEHAGIDSIDKIELLEENIEKISIRINNRITFYKWLIGAIWAIYLIINKFETKLILSGKVESINKVLNSSTKELALTLVIMAATLFAVLCYQKANEFIVKSIEFGCIDLKCKLSNNQEP
ncbi:MAG: hypothetical protein GY760_01395 [Deltaproteobacteria bacterium]|nr:hypothetical protein [Deltaproteobacteria bacterium]